ncbi:hypothetical protein [Peristeroidobacter agariperforans]|uniref:hypothetical protein n=1 Tax=Peristeroidobacter agariperforans TaxID=268404 RepID=UPI00101CDF84|nr:hypothetical protein [Peristeroidobacter agariperforans]
MVDALLRWMAIFSITAFALPAWACFPSPGARPTHEISVVDLPRKAIGVGVVLESKGYAVRVLATDLLPLLSQESIVAPRDLTKAVRAKMALGEDFDTRDLINALTSDPEKQRWVAMRTNDRLRYAYAKLLQEGKASVTDPASNIELTQVKLDRFTDICSSGRTFTTLDREVVLHVMDAIS